MLTEVRLLPAVQSPFRDWRLRDLVIASHYHHNSTCNEARELGLHLARVFPFLTTLNGCDIRDVPQSGPAEEEWIWNRNALLLKITAERRRLIASTGV